MPPAREYHQDSAPQRLDDAITALSAHATTQTGSTLDSEGATQKKNSLRLVLLRDHMAPLSRIARADLPHTPKLEPVKMPVGKPTAEQPKRARGQPTSRAGGM